MVSDSTGRAITILNVRQTANSNSTIILLVLMAAVVLLMGKVKEAVEARGILIGQLLQENMKY